MTCRAASHATQEEGISQVAKLKQELSDMQYRADERVAKLEQELSDMQHHAKEQAAELHASTRQHGEGLTKRTGSSVYADCMNCKLHLVDVLVESPDSTSEGCILEAAPVAICC